jgi:hypothetical protein
MPEERPDDDPVAELLRAGEASTVDEAEELYLDRNLEEVVSLVRSALPDAAFRRHPSSPCSWPGGAAASKLRDVTAERP